MTDAERIRREALEEARLVAICNEPDKFERYGTRKLYWKGRADVAEVIRKLAEQPAKNGGDA